ncbi:UNVERIFIED_CONTAM: Gag-Pol polyprotein [Sesamum latifolium]|uniref:Gag-Pol polyprotein n=1 Tax=Sesamum latifolium TaxID=2727402 RepID=A0AAW2Y782_9LAMI
MKQDARYLVNKCEKCQRHATLIHQPAEPLNVMLSPCPFSQWGMGIVGPFSLAPGQRKFLLVAIDYFTKWVEAEPLARITEGEVMKFIWKNIICRFGLPQEIIFDNGRQFQGRRIQEWCEGLHIKQRFTSVSHPQANGQVEVTNHILVQGIKKRLDRVVDNWFEELISVLWSYRTTPRGSTGKKPFHLGLWNRGNHPSRIGNTFAQNTTL